MTLTPTRTIAIQDWMIVPETQAIFDVLQDKAAPPQILFVGGCVRNTILGRPPGDMDMATTHAPDDTMRRLQAVGIKVVPTGIDHGTVTAVVNGQPFEITTLRRDVETDGRHAVVAFTDDWVVDAKRRDFTMNTLLADHHGNIYDPLRRGIIDLEDGRVLFVGDPAQRIAEDYLRILRFFRFHALYGAGAPDDAALAACRAAADKISTLSRERITQEMTKILLAGDPSETLIQMFEHNVMVDYLHPEFQPGVMAQLCGIQQRLGSIMLESRLVALCAGDSGFMRIVEKYLLLSNAQTKNLESLFRAIDDPADIRERLFRYGRAIGGQSALLLAALKGVKIDEARMDIIRDWDIPVYPLTGADLKKLGVAEGPEMGRILREVEIWWIEWDFQPGVDQCLERARILLAGD